MFNGFVALDKVDILRESSAGSNDQIVLFGGFYFAVFSVYGTCISKMTGSGTRQKITNAAFTVENAMDGQIRRSEGFKFRQIFRQGIFIQYARSAKR